MSDAEDKLRTKMGDWLTEVDASDERRTATMEKVQEAIQVQRERSAEITSEQARKVLEDEQNARLREFQQKLDALCKEYNVTFQVQQNIVVVPNAA